jgi:hypothetical protein
MPITWRVWLFVKREGYMEAANVKDEFVFSYPKRQETAFSIQMDCPTFIFEVSGSWCMDCFNISRLVIVKQVRLQM